MVSLTNDLKITLLLDVVSFFITPLLILFSTFLVFPHFPDCIFYFSAMFISVEML